MRAEKVGMDREGQKGVKREWLGTCGNREKKRKKNGIWGSKQSSLYAAPAALARSWQVSGDDASLGPWEEASRIVCQPTVVPYGFYENYKKYHKASSYVDGLIMLLEV